MRGNSSDTYRIRPPGVSRGLRGASRFAVGALALITGLGSGLGRTGRGSCGAHRPGVLQDRRLPARLHPHRHRRHPDARRAERLRRRGDRGRGGVHGREPRPLLRRRVALDHRRRAQRRAADGVRELHRHGGGYAGVHAAADTEYDWPWYGELVGAYFKSHPAIQQATVDVEGHDHPSTARLPDQLDAHRRVVQLPDQPADRGEGARLARRVHLRRGRGRDGRPPDHVVPRPGRRPVLVHRRRPHHRVLQRAGVRLPPRWAASSTRPASSRPTARRTPTRPTRRWTPTSTRSRWPRASR